MITKQVTLSTGVTVTVAPVPQKIYDVIRMKHPDPPVPVLESNKTATGEVMRYENREDPDYQRSMMEAAQARQMAWAEAMLLFGLPEVVIPEGYGCPRCQFTAKSEEDIRRVIAPSEDGTYCCPRCFEDCDFPQGDDIPTLELYAWEPPISELAYIDPDWKPRKGDQGRKLDYIEWELLRAPGDHQKVVAAIGDLAMIPEGAVDAVEDTFQGDVEVQGQAGSADRQLQSVRPDADKQTV